MKKIVQHSFLGGQLDWEMMGRQDVEKYRSGATLLKNVVLHKRGAAFKRPGTDFLHDVTSRISNAHFRLVPFASTDAQGFALLFTDGAVCAVCASGVYAVSLPTDFTPYAGDELRELDYCQCGDVVFVAHRSHPPCRISHTASGSSHAFALEVIDLNVQSTGVPAITKSVVTKTAVTTESTSYVEEYKATAVYDGVETYPCAAFSNSNCKDYDAGYAKLQQENNTLTALGGAAKVYKPPKAEYDGTAYTLPWTESQKITLTLSVPNRGGVRPEQVRIYRKSGSFFGLVGIVDTSSTWSEADTKTSVSATSATLYAGTKSSSSSVGSNVNARNALNEANLTCGAFGAHANGFRVTGAIALTLSKTANRATVSLKLGHVSYAQTKQSPGFSDYDGTRTYNEGDGCRHDSKNYVCGYDGTTGAFDADNWTELEGTPYRRVYKYAPCRASKFTVRLGNGTAKEVAVASGTYAEKTYYQNKNEEMADFVIRAEEAAEEWAKSLDGDKEATVVAEADVASASLTVTPTYAAGFSSFVVHNVTASGAKRDRAPSKVTWEDKYYTPDVSLTPPSETDVMQTQGDWPGCVCLSQQRLIWASTENDPSRVFMSEVGAFYTYAPHDAMVADDPIDFEVSATQFPRVNHIAELRKLVLFNGASEWIVDSASANSGITFETIRATQHSCIGSSATLKPLVCNNVLLFAERTGQAVRQYGYALDDDGFGGTDVSVFSQSIFNEKKIVAWAYQQHPHSTCWCVLSDGTLASLTFNREQQCVAWATHALGGGGEAVDIACTQALVGNAGGLCDTSEVLLLVRRGNAYAVERMRPEPKDGTDTPAHFVCMDSVREVGSADARRGGTTLVDLATMRTASARAAGARYAEGYPFDMRITTAYPVVADEVGMAQMDVKCVQFAGLRLMRAVGGKVKNAGQPDEEAASLAKTALPSVSGGTATLPSVDERVILPAVESRDGRITVFQDAPYPFGVTLLETDVETEEGE